MFVTRDGSTSLVQTALVDEEERRMSGARETGHSRGRFGFGGGQVTAITG